MHDALRAKARDLIYELDDIARDYLPHELGLPVDDAEVGELLVQAVLEFARSVSNYDS